MNKTDFIVDIEKGKISERFFINNFVSFLGLPCKDVSDDIEYRKKDIDLLLPKTTIDVKTVKEKYFNKNIIIEDYTNYRPEINMISKGWFFKSKANLIAFVCLELKSIILLRFDDNFKEWYELNKENYRLIKNKPSYAGGNEWVSAFRAIPCFHIKPFIAYYKFDNVNEYEYEFKPLKEKEKEKELKYKKGRIKKVSQLVLFQK